MKTLQNMNNIILTICIVSGLLGFMDSGFWAGIGWLSAPLGLFQSVTGIILFISRPRSIRFQLYIGGLILFIITCYLPIENAWMILPVPLALYFTFMIHTVHQKRTLSF
ncbi:hypothetical protein [Dokdonia sp.]|uniref:hypothetical protein n=1 Tax=Dokdonia sp. TaxID=2024995 RepID=UPI003267802B